MVMIIITIFQILVANILLNFLTFVPFFNAYFLFYFFEINLKGRKAKREVLYKEIRSGQHSRYIFTQKMINLFSALSQIFMMSAFIISLHIKNEDGDSLYNQLERIMIVECSEGAINQYIQNEFKAIELIHYWIWIFVYIFLVGLYIDFFAYKTDINKTTRFCVRKFKDICLC